MGLSKSFKKAAGLATFGMVGGASLGAAGDLLKGPDAPDSGELANAQTQSNLATARTNARLNRINTSSPFGSRTYTDLGNDQWSMQDSLNPQDQSLLDTRRRISGGLGARAETNLGSNYDLSQFGHLPGVNDFGSERDSLTDAVYRRSTSMLDPQFERGEDKLRTRLVNQGVTEGSEAWRNATGDFNRSRDMAYGDARDRAVTAGATEQSRLFDLGMRSRQQGIGEYERQRYSPINEISQLSAMNPTMQNFGPTPQVGVPGVDISGMMQDQYNANATQRNNTMGGLFQMGAAALPFMLSDRRAKDDIKKVGKTDSGLNVYTYKYKGDDKTQMGVMAQEVEKVDPLAVAVSNSGLKMVDYSRI